MGDDHRLVMCYNRAKGHYFLPGGRLDPDETVKTCLARELQEEMYLEEVAIQDFLGCMETHWQEGQECYQEFSFLFRVQVPVDWLDRPIVSKEDHIAFEVLTINDLLTRPNVQPAQLKTFFEKHYPQEDAIRSGLPRARAPRKDKNCACFWLSSK